MKSEVFYFEIQDLLIQFLAAFDDTVIKRYENNTRTSSQKIQVRYVYAPKQRVLQDLINPGQNITLPVVSVSLNSVQRDNERVFNKNAGFLNPLINNDFNRAPTTNYYRSPVPVNLGITMSILTKNQLDMDQILSNFISFSNPYIVISWKLPATFSPEYTQEIRTEVLWSGDVSLTYPVELNNTQKTQVIADTNFTIKGWIFPFSQPVKNIFKIDVNTYATNTKTNLESVNYFTLSGSGLTKDENEELFYSNTFSTTAFPVLNNVKIIVEN
jgi:hypothetical protein